MRRREVLAGLLGAAFARPSPADAQQKRMPVIGVLGLGWPEHPAIMLNLAGMREGLKQSGFVEGQNVAIEFRWAHGDERRLPGLAADLVARRVDVIVTEGGNPSALAAKQATGTIPVIFHSADAIANGLVSNLARPEGNLTGLSLFAPEVLVKEFQLISELLPEAREFDVLELPKAQIVYPLVAPEVEKAALARGVRLQVVDGTRPDELERIYQQLARRGGALVVHANATFAERLVGLAERHALPCVYGQRAFAVAGGLLSYGISLPAVYIVKGRYAARILRGAQPAELPVQQPTTFELVLNLKTAKALGLAVPQSLLARADEVIE